MSISLKKSRIFVLLILLLLALIAGLLLRYGVSESPKSLKDSMPVVRYRLANGLEVLVVENHRIPAISHTMFVKLGSADDPPGKSGLAHYLEHLLFKGTPEVSAASYDARLAALGAETNAFTTSDYTAYYVNAPKQALEQVMALEADRFAHSQFADAVADTERAVIAEERRQRVDNTPSSQLAEQMDAVQYLVHPYRVPVIGWAQDIEKLSGADARAHFARHYVPHSMVLVVAGDVDPKQVRRLAMKYFGGLNNRRAPVRHWAKEPPMLTQKTITLRDGRVKQPQWWRSYSVVSLGLDRTGLGVAGKAHADDTLALELGAEWLGADKVGALYKALVLEEAVALSVSVRYSDAVRGPAAWVIEVIPREGVGLGQLGDAVDATLAKLLAQGPDEAALMRAKTRYQASITFARDGLATIARYIGTLRMLGKDESYFYSLPERIKRITAAQVREVMQQSLTPERSVTGLLMPEATQPARAMLTHSADTPVADTQSDMQLPAESPTSDESEQ